MKPRVSAYCCSGSSRLLRAAGKLTPILSPNSLLSIPGPSECCTGLQWMMVGARVICRMTCVILSRFSINAADGEQFGAGLKTTTTVRCLTAHRCSFSGPCRFPSNNFSQTCNPCTTICSRTSGTSC